MPIFKPKSGPVLQWNRVVHFLAAATATAYGGHLWGYEGSVFVGFGMIIVGFLWELSNKIFPNLFKDKKIHPFGDAIDFWAFVLGAVVAGIGWLILGQNKPY